MRATSDAEPGLWSSLRSIVRDGSKSRVSTTRESPTHAHFTCTSPSSLFLKKSTAAVVPEGSRRLISSSSCSNAVTTAASNAGWNPSRVAFTNDAVSYRYARHAFCLKNASVTRGTRCATQWRAANFPPCQSYSCTTASNSPGAAPVTHAQSSSLRDGHCATPKLRGLCKKKYDGKIRVFFPRDGGVGGERGNARGRWKK